MSVYESKSWVPVYYDPDAGQGVSVSAALPSGLRISRAQQVLFCYMRLQGGQIEIDRYLQDFGQDIDPGELPSIIEKLAANARGAGSDPEPQREHDLESLKLSKVSYMVFFLDEQHWTFACENDDPGQPIVPFHKRAKPSGKDPWPNLSYRLGEVLSIKTDTGVRQALAWINLVLDENGSQREPDSPPYSTYCEFDLFLSAPLAKSGGKRQTVVFDPGGESEGPP